MLWIRFLFIFFRRVMSLVVFFFKQKTAYEMRISDWSSDVCSSDLQYDHLGIRLNFSDPVFAASHNGMTAALSASVDASTAAQMAMAQQAQQVAQQAIMLAGDRKSTRLNSSH